MAAASALSSGQPTPTATAMGSSVTNSPIFNSQLNDDDDDDEDRKPNVEFLDSLNAYRKRSRSTEDIGQPLKVKVTRLDNALGVNGHGYLNGYASHNGSNGSLVETEPPLSQDTVMGSLLQETGFTELLDDPICYGWL